MAKRGSLQTVTWLKQLADCILPSGAQKRKRLVSDCNLRQSARHLKGTYKGDFFIFFIVVEYVWLIVILLGLKELPP